jgi:hypothetical protein
MKKDKIKINKNFNEIFKQNHYEAYSCSFSFFLCAFYLVIAAS